MQFFFTEIEGNKIKDARIVHQLWIVLRWKIWNKFFTLDWKWSKKMTEIVKFGKKEIDVKVLSEERIIISNKKIRLFQWLPKLKSKWEFILQKWSELWVSEFVPVISEYSNAKYPTNTARENLIIIETSEQCERIFLPKIHEEIKLKEIFNKFEWDFYFFDSSQKDLPDQFDIQDKIQNEKKINVIIWPEWGFSKEEINLIKKQKNCTFLSLWKNILRLETAVIVALARIR